jgi:prolyl-tRNA editing enzyme YbaK/EbsC (Cys-tRNA(Pro) deacylase)
MSVESVREFLREKAPDVTVVELERSSATMTLAAEWNVKPAQIAKSLLLRIGERNLLIVACGDSRLDNRKVKAVFGGKARMVPPEEATELTGHPVGGVCPFGLATSLPIYFDVLLKGYEEVVPAAGSTRTAIRVHPLRMATLVGAEWVDICETPTCRWEAP